MKQSCPSICPIDYCTKIDEEPLIERDQMLASAFYTFGTVQMQVLAQKFVRKSIVVLKELINVESVFKNIFSR